MGIGFAVPINMARQVMDQLVTRGRLNRGYLGVAVQELTPPSPAGSGCPSRAASSCPTSRRTGRRRRPACSAAT